MGRLGVSNNFGAAAAMNFVRGIGCRNVAARPLAVDFWCDIWRSKELSI